MFVYRVIIWVSTILNHIDTKVILPRYRDSCLVYRPKSYIENVKLILDT